MSPGVIAALLLISIFSFGALITLSGFAGDLKQSNRGQAHALSRSATGFAGMVQLLRDQGWDMSLARGEERASDYSGALHIYTFTHPYQLSELEYDRLEDPTLIVLPKWNVRNLELNEDWVQPRREPFGPVYGGKGIETNLAKLLPDIEIGRVSENTTETYVVEGHGDIYPAANDVPFKRLQYFKGEDLSVLMSLGGKPVLIHIPETQAFVLSDPDFLNTSGISVRRKAELGQGIIAAVITESGAYPRTAVFDLNVHGFAKTQNLVKTMLTPPFLAATLCLLAAAALIGWQAVMRFGDPVEEAPDHELGKYTLVDNGARFIRLAEKETGMAEGYVALNRRLAAEPFSLEKKSIEDIEEFFAKREERIQMGSGWSHFKNRLLRVKGKHAFLDAAKALYKWRGDITHDSR